MIAFVMNLLGVPRWAAWAITAGTAGLLLWGANALFDNWLNDVKREAMEAQRVADELAAKDAAIEAERRQQRKIDAARNEGIRIGKEQADDNAKANAGIDAAADALGKLWRAEAQAHSGGAGRGQAAGISGAASGDIAAASCAAQGWISLPLAIQLAAGADREAARGDSLQRFIEGVAAAWPKGEADARNP